MKKKKREGKKKIQKGRRKKKRKEKEKERRKEKGKKKNRKSIAWIYKPHIQTSYSSRIKWQFLSFIIIIIILSIYKCK